MPDNTSDACASLEIIMSIISMKCGSTGKSSIHKIGQISNSYPKNNAFDVGLGIQWFALDFKKPVRERVSSTSMSVPVTSQDLVSQDF